MHLHHLRTSRSSPLPFFEFDSLLLTAVLDLQVLGATSACTSLVTPGAVPPANFTLMLLKSGVPLQNSFTVLHCSTGVASCYVYRLSSPCQAGVPGRCITTPDPTLNQGLFSAKPPLGIKCVGGWLVMLLPRSAQPIGSRKRNKAAAGNCSGICPPSLTCSPSLTDGPLPARLQVPRRLCVAVHVLVQPCKSQCELKHCFFHGFIMTLGLEDLPCQNPASLPPPNLHPVLFVHGKCRIRRPCLVRMFNGRCMWESNMTRTILW